MEDLISKLTAKDNKYACALADKIISESKESDKWYEYFDDFAALLNHQNSLVRNRAVYILRQTCSGTVITNLTLFCLNF